MDVASHGRVCWRLVLAEPLVDFEEPQGEVLGELATQAHPALRREERLAAQRAPPRRILKWLNGMKENGTCWPKLESKCLHAPRDRLDEAELVQGGTRGQSMRVLCRKSGLPSSYEGSPDGAP